MILEFLKEAVKVIGACTFVLLFICLVVFVTDKPIVVYSSETVEYIEGYPNIQLTDVVGVYTRDGEKISHSQWGEVLSAGRYRPEPASPRE